MKKSKGLRNFILGVGIGAGISALFTTNKGKEIRSQLKSKIEDLVSKAKELDVKEVSEQFLEKVDEIKSGLADLDREKIVKIASKKGEELKKKAEELVKLAKEKGTPVLEKAASDVKEKTIEVIKDILAKLEA